MNVNHPLLYPPLHTPGFEKFMPKGMKGSNTKVADKATPNGGGGGGPGGDKGGGECLSAVSASSRCSLYSIVNVRVRRLDVSWEVG